MTRRLKPVDAVIVGYGWTGAIMAKTLSDAGLNVVALERGPARDTSPDFEYPRIIDELRHGVRGDLWQRLATETVTIRHRMDHVAVPYRQYGSFILGNGVGGAGVHWNGQLFRADPVDMQIRSHYSGRYGRSFIPDDMTIQDYPVSYTELEPYFDHFEKVCAASGSAGNLRGTLHAGGNPFEGIRSNAYPTPAMPAIEGARRVAEAAKGLGYHPFPMPNANTPVPYTNPYGVRLGPCNLCGFCDLFGCFLYSKASPQTTILPVLTGRSNLEVRTDSMVTRVLLDSDGQRATGVVYIDKDGQECVQPAELVMLCAFQLHNVRLLLLSGIGTPYDPTTGRGTVGKNFAYQICSGATMTFNEDVHINPFIGAGGAGQIVIDDFNSDHFDHAEHGFVGGSAIFGGATGGRPIKQMPLPPGTPRWGEKWKEAVRRSYRHTTTATAIGSVMGYRDRYLDLDPTYKDAFGQPLLRMTFDWHENEYRMAAFCADKLDEIAKAMNPESYGVSSIKAGTTYDTRKYQTTHLTGGAIMGSDPTNSVVNRYSQCWDVPNVFVYGSSSFPQNLGYNPTGLIGALTYFSAARLRDNYLASPSRLVDA